MFVKILQSTLDGHLMTINDILNCEWNLIKNTQGEDLCYMTTFQSRYKILMFHFMKNYRIDSYGSLFYYNVYANHFQMKYLTLKLS